MIKERLHLENGESRLVRMYSIKDLVLIRSHYSKKLNLDVTICFPVIQKGCRFCQDYGRDLSDFGRELKRHYNLMYILADSTVGELKLLFTQNEDNDIDLLNSFKRYSDKFSTHFLKLTKKNNYYTVKPVRNMSLAKKTEFEKLNDLIITGEWIADCTIILDAKQISTLIHELRKEYFSN